MNNSDDKSKAKLEAALRANLARRKQQARARATPDAPSGKKPAQGPPSHAMDLNRKKP